MLAAVLSRAHRPAMRASARRGGALALRVFDPQQPECATRAPLGIDAVQTDWLRVRHKQPAVRNIWHSATLVGSSDTVDLDLLRCRGSSQLSAGRVRLAVRAADMARRCADSLAQQLCMRLDGRRTSNALAVQRCAI